VSIELDDVKLTFCEWLDIKTHEVVDVVLGTIIANEFNADPLSLYLIGPPSVGKTEILRALNGHPRVYPISTLTPNTFISGMKGKAVSLLPTLTKDGKTILVVKDFTTILETKADSRAELISQIREIMDGSYKKSFGTGRTIAWEGKLALICGVTPVIDKYHSVNSVLGERFINFRLETNETNKMSEKAFSMSGKEGAMRKELQEVTCQFLSQFKAVSLKKIQINPEVKEKLFALTSLIAKGRTGVSRDRYTHMIDYLPQPEGTPRLLKQLWIMGAGIATIHRKDEFDEDVFKVILKVGRDSLPRHRDHILRTMFQKGLHGMEWETTKALSRLINCPTTTARTYFEDLMMVGLLDRRIQGEDEDGEEWKTRETTPYLWKLSHECVDLIRRCKAYDEAELPEEDIGYDENSDFRA
jgi:hypothetical protein